MKPIRHILAAALVAIASLANAATTIHVPDSFLPAAVQGTVVFGTDTVKCGLYTSAYTYARASDIYRSAVTEATGTGYTAGGQTVTVAVTKDTAAHQTTITYPQVVWSGSTTITARGMFCYKSRGGAASADELLMVADFGVDVSSSAGTYTVNSITVNFTHF